MGEVISIVSPNLGTLIAGRCIMGRESTSPAPKSTSPVADPPSSPIQCSRRRPLPLHIFNLCCRDCSRKTPWSSWLSASVSEHRRPCRGLLCRLRHRQRRRRPCFSNPFHDSGALFTILSKLSKGKSDSVAAQIALCLVLCVGMFFLPYSPRWLLHRGRVDEARHVMQMLDKPGYEAEKEEALATGRTPTEAGGSANSSNIFAKDVLGRTLWAGCKRCSKKEARECFRLTWLICRAASESATDRRQ